MRQFHFKCVETFLIMKNLSIRFEYLCYAPTAITIYHSFSAGINFRQQNLTAIDIRFRRLKTVPVLKGLTKHLLKTILSILMIFNPLTAKLFNLNFHPLEVVSR